MPCASDEQRREPSISAWENTAYWSRKDLVTSGRPEKTFSSSSLLSLKRRGEGGEPVNLASMFGYESLGGLHITEGEDAWGASVEVSVHRLFVRSNDRLVTGAGVDIAVLHDVRLRRD